MQLPYVSRHFDRLNFDKRLGKNVDYSEDEYTFEVAVLAADVNFLSCPVGKMDGFKLHLDTKSEGHHRETCLLRVSSRDLCAKKEHCHR